MQDVQVAFRAAWCWHQQVLVGLNPATDEDSGYPEPWHLRPAAGHLSCVTQEAFPSSCRGAADPEVPEIIPQIQLGCGSIHLYDPYGSLTLLQAQGCIFSMPRKNR